MRNLSSASSKRSRTDSLSRSVIKTSTRQSWNDTTILHHHLELNRFVGHSIRCSARGKECSDGSSVEVPGGVPA